MKIPPLDRRPFWEKMADPWIFGRLVLYSLLLAALGLVFAYMYPEVMFEFMYLFVFTPKHMGYFCLGLAGAWVLLFAVARLRQRMRS